jgi:hypothetical protein
VWLAVGLFAAAGLARETLLVVPVALLLAEAWEDRRRIPWPLLGSLVPYAGWLAVVRVHIGAWPKGSVSGRLSPVPFGGLAAAAGSWRRDEVLAGLVLLVLVGAGLVLGRDRRLRLVVGANLALAAVLGEPVWARYLDFGRVLLPLTLASVLSVASGLAASRAAATAREAPTEPVGTPAARRSGATVGALPVPH